MTQLRWLDDIKLAYKCPICSHFYYQSQYTSRYIPQSIRYTDGFSAGSFRRSGFVCCPKCHSVFSKKLLIPLTEKEEITANEENENHDPQSISFGSVDNDFFDSKTFTKRWWKLFENGLVFLYNDSEDERNYMTKRLYIHTWQLYHLRHRENVKESQTTLNKYAGICENISKLLNRDDYKDLFILAELDRNDGHFDSCLDTLNAIDNIPNLDWEGHKLSGVMHFAVENRITDTLPVLPKFYRTYFCSHIE